MDAGGSAGGREVVIGAAISGPGPRVENWGRCMGNVVASADTITPM